MAQKHLKIICVMVSSLNGKTTNGTDPHIYNWTSKEDQAHFFDLIEYAELIIMGKNTYENAKSMMKHKPGRLRVVLTTRPEKYANATIPGQLEFTSDKPSQLIGKLQKRGFEQALLVGGSQTNSSFLNENLVDELWLTLEPKVFRKGISLFTRNILQKKLQLFSVEKLNTNGTILLKYISN